MDNSEKKSKFLEEGKLIVKGLAKKTTESELRKHFQKYGRVSEAIIYGGDVRRRNRYYLNGFVVFKHPKDIINVLAEDHIIDDRHVAIERADKLKIFVEGLPYIISEKAVTKCFEGCGRITNVQFDRWNCVITFTSKEAVEQAVNLPPILLNGKSVAVKQAPEHPEGEGEGEGAAAVSPLLSLILFVKERIQDILDWCRLRVAGHRPLPPWRIWMLREEKCFKPRKNDDPAKQAEHVKLARAAFARATERDNEIEGEDDDCIRVVPHDYLPPVDKSLLENLENWNDKPLLKRWKDWNDEPLLKLLNDGNDELDLEKWD